MALQSQITFRINEQDKLEFESFCEEVGLNVSTALNLFVKRVNQEHRIPFIIAEPNAETREAIKEVQEMKKNPHMGKTYTNVDEMMKELLG